MQTALNVICVKKFVVNLTVLLKNTDVHADRAWSVTLTNHKQINVQNAIKKFVQNITGIVTIVTKKYFVIDVHFLNITHITIGD